jgi:N-acetylmuramoyl-L-alanine amidase
MNRRILVLLAALLLPLPARAQAPALRIAAPGASIEVPGALHRGYPAYPASALQAIGASVEETPRGVRVVLFGDTLNFEATSPFFVAGGRAVQLAGAVYREGGIVYLPHQLFAEWLPERFARDLAFSGTTLRVLARDAGARPPAASPRAATQPPATPPPVARTEVERPPVATPRPQQRARTERVVVIDPGHGGRDPGKVGPNGVREKDVVLSVGHQLAALLRQRGYEVHMTRTDDTLVPLAERPRMANKLKAGRPAALFISLHANSGPPRAEGFETFFLSEARTEDERRVAEIENAAIAFEDRPADEPLPELEHILKNLLNDHYLIASNNLAETVQRHLAGFHAGPNRGVKQAGFRVLVGAFMPAVLVELAFVSNTREAALLASAPFQQKLAWALADATDEFFASHEHLWVAGTGQ